MNRRPATLLTLLAFAAGLRADLVATNTVNAAAVKTSFTVDNFDDADNTNDAGGLKGAMDPAEPVDAVTATYDSAVRLGGAGSSLKLQYTLTGEPWSGFWNQLAPGAAPRDLALYKTLVFWVRGATGGVEHAKIELGNASSKGIVYLNDAAGPVTNAWREIRIPLTSFTAAGLNSLANAKEVNFVFESGYATDHGLPLTGTIYIDGLEFSTLD